MSVRSSITDHLTYPLLALILLALPLGSVACDCGDEEHPTEESQAPEEVVERDRAAEVPTPDTVGALGSDFDPDEKSRIVEPENWQISMRSAGPPEAMPTDFVIAIDRSIVRRGSPQVSPGTRVSITDDNGQEIGVTDLSFTDNFSVLQMKFADDLTPATTYTVALDALEFDFDHSDEDDLEFIEFNEPPTATFETPPLELIDISPARPVGAFAHVEMRFSAPVNINELAEHLQWTLNGSEPADITYGGEGRVVSARLRSHNFNFASDTRQINLTGGPNLVSTLGGEPMGSIDQSVAVGASSQALEIRAVGLYERAGAPTLRVLCHDPSFGDTRSYWDREIRQYISQISRRCDVDTERALELVKLDVDANLSVVDHQHGFDIVLDLQGIRGPLGVALRTGNWGDEIPDLFEGKEEFITPRFSGPELAIAADGRYLKRSDWDAVPIRHSGVELVRVVVRHSADDHFTFWLSGDDQMTQTSSFAVAEKYIELDPGPEEAQYSYINLQEIVGDPEPGAYQVEVTAPYQGGLQHSHRFLVSDIQLIAKRSSHIEQEVDEVWAWTIDVESTEPVSNVNLELVRHNGQVLATCETNNDGFCELNGNWGDLENEPPFAVVAEGSDQLAYVDWNDTKTAVVEGEIGGANYHDDPPYSGAIRGERTLYRPGETMHFAGFVRGEQYRGEPNIPVGVKISNSRNQEVYGAVLTTNEVGALEFEYDLPEMASTGTWNVELFSGDSELASQDISVEEFIPERVEVTLHVHDVVIRDGAGFTGDLEAQYFFGTAAADANFEIRCRFEPTNPFREEWPQFSFGPFDDNVESVTAHFDGTLGQDGQAEFQCNPPNINEDAPYRVEITASVFEAGSGRPAKAIEEITMLPGTEIVGLRSPDARVDQTEGARIEGIVVDPDGRVVTYADTIDIELGSIRYSWTRLYRNGRMNWERERHESVDERRQLDLTDGRFTMRADPRGSSVGIYFRAERRAAVTELEVGSPQRYWGWGQRDLDPRPDDPAHINIEGPDELILNQPAEFSFEAPVRGRALVAVETNRVDSWSWIDVEPGPNTWEVEVDQFDPNVYVSVLYIPTGDDAPEGLDRGFGVQRVDLARDRWEAAIDIDAPDELRPGDMLEINVHSSTVGPNAQVAVAAVDRGILSMANFEFENPLAQLFLTRALGVDTFDTVGWYADVSPLRFGGGAGMAESAPQTIMPVTPTSMWSGLVDLDDDGRATITFPIPDFRGEFDITAVVVDGNRLGEASTRTLIRDPLALQATAPRFATHGDQIRIPVSVTNTTERPVDIEVRADVLSDLMLEQQDTAALTITSPTSGALQLQPDERGQVLFDVQVDGRAGVPRLVFNASGSGEESRHTVRIPIYPDGPTTVEQEHHSVDTQEFNVLAKLDGWLPTSETTEIWVTSIPRAPAFVHLQHILHYPYLRLGTNLYNTVARVRPMIYLDQLLQAADPGSSTRSANWRITSGIRGIERLQQPSGQFTFWPTGSSAVGPWGQAYVLDMLTSAENADFDVPDHVLRHGLDWLDRRVQRRHQIEDLDLAIWVLARQDRPNRRAARALLESLPDNPTGRDHERALLATASLHLAGDETVLDDLRALIAEPKLDPQDRRYSGDHYSPARHEGLVLEVAIEIFGTDHELLVDLVEKVADRLVDAKVGDLNIIELGWSVAALGRWAEAQSGNIPEARLFAAGTEIEPDITAEDGSRSWQLHRASEYPSVRLIFDETPENPVSVFRRSEGVQAAASADFGREGLRLQRIYRDAQGNPISLNNVEVGDLIYVELIASHSEDSTLENLALVDRFAGGFEIENPRPEGNIRPTWFNSNEQWNVDHFDVRDDRIEVFGQIRANQRVRFLYTMRATTAGTFSTPPAELTSIYQNNRWARIAGDTVRISRP